MKNIKIYLLTAVLLLITASTLYAGGIKLEEGFKLAPAIIMIGIIFLFLAIGYFNQAEDTGDFYAAGRSISRVGSGMAIASNWMSAASFLGMAAIMYGTGYHGLSYVIGWTGGYVLLLVLMAAQIRRFGQYTAPDFIGERYYSRNLRAVTAIMTFVISFCYCVGQFGGIGLMFVWILGLPYTWAVIIGSTVVLAYTMISGMLGVTKNQQVQYVIIIISFIIPAVIMCYKFDYFWLLPQIGYGSVVSDIVTGTSKEFVGTLGSTFAILPSPEFAMPWDPSTGKSFFQWMAICFSLMLGTAGLPHVIAKFYVVPKPSDARWSVVWGLFFICLLYWTAPLYSAFGKILSANPEMGKLSKDAIVVYTAQLGDVHHLIVGFLAAGAVSAAFSTVSGLLVAGASAFSHDLYYKVLNPEATSEQQMFMAKVGTIVMAVGVMAVAIMKLALIAQLVAVAFSLAACTLFPMFLLGIWWSGSNRAGAAAGLTAGLAVSLLAIVYFVAGKFGVVLPAKEFIDYYINPWYFAWLGAPVAVIVHIFVALITEDTPEDIKKFLAVSVHGAEE